MVRDEGKHSDTNDNRPARRMDVDKDTTEDLSAAVEAARKSGGKTVSRKVVDDK